MLSKVLVYLILKYTFIPSWTDATFTESVTESFVWDGAAAYIPVDRQVIQDRLNSWYESVSNECGGPRLYLPTNSVFPDILDENQHVVYIDSGHTEFRDFQDLANECNGNSMIKGVEFGVTIPLLTDDPDGIPHYSLALAKFYDRSRGDIPKGNFAFPYIPVDELFMNNTMVYMRNGSDELQISIQRLTHPCKKLKAAVRHEFDAFIEREYQLGAYEPHFDFCNRHPIDNNFCRKARSIKCQVSRETPNFCQSSWKAPDKGSCVTPFAITKATKWFRQFMLLGEGEIDIVASESLFGNFSMGIKYPCIE